MPWPKGYSREQIRAMLPEERKDLFRKQEKVETLNAEAPVIEFSPPPPRPKLEARAASKPAEKKSWAMKAGNNWDNATPADESPDRLYIPREDFPEGMDLLWATKTIYGQEQTRRLNGFYRTGWTPVHADDFDGRFANRFSQDESGYVVHESSILCARPLSISIAAKKREETRAKEQIAIKEQAFKGGEIAATGADHPSARSFNRISRTMERVEIPKD